MVKKCLFIFITGLILSPLHAVQPNRFERIAASPSLIGETQAIQIALSAVPGKALSAQLVTVNDRKIYRVKILSNDGRVRTVNVDAEKGRVI